MQTVVEADRLHKLQLESVILDSAKMLVRQHSDSMVSISNSNNKMKKRRLLRKLPSQSSPLLIISKSRTDLATSSSLDSVDEHTPEGNYNQEVLEVSCLHCAAIILAPQAKQAKTSYILYTVNYYS